MVTTGIPLNIGYNECDVIQITRNAILFSIEINFMFWTKLPFQVREIIRTVVWVSVGAALNRFISRLFKLGYNHNEQLVNWPIVVSTPGGGGEVFAQNI